MNQHVANNKFGLSERGISTLEFTITLPIIILIMMATADLGRLIERYLTVNRIAYEGARFAAAVGGLEIADDVSGSAELAANPSHTRVHERLDTLLARYNIPRSEVKVEETSMKVNCGGDRKPRVVVRVGVNFEALFPLFNVIDEVKVEATGPYLYQGVCS